MAAYFCTTLFFTSALLFFVQPLCGKMLLPVLGGSPAVWNTCVLFFQAALLLGYAYVHSATRNLRWHSVLHVALLAGALWFLPVRFALSDPSERQPVLWLLLVLIAGVGMPFLMLSASAPLVQKWFAATAHRAAGNPYFLYAASNLGSLVALLGYPFLVEPNLTLQEQNRLWLYLYVLVIVLLAGCVVMLWRQDVQAPTLRVDSRPPSFARALRWLLLALVPSSLMLSVTTYLTTDIAPIPFLWVVPLALYLLTFVIAFSGNGAAPFFGRWAPLAALVLILTLLLEAKQPLLVVVGIHLLGLFWLALVCHGELARLRPEAAQLTSYYLWIAVGGMLGGVINALAAPMLFQRVVEYPLMILAACMLRPAQHPHLPAGRTGGGDRAGLRSDFLVALAIGAATALAIWLVQNLALLPPGQLSVAVLFAPPLLLAYLMHERPLRSGLAFGAILVASALYHGLHGQEIYVQRSFFGVHRVTQDGRFRYLIHGATQHGQQNLDPAYRSIPLMYYYPDGPIGQLITALRGDPRLQRVGLIGLGCGALAAYAEPGQRWTFFEIDPAVIHIARDTGYFTYLRDSRGEVDIQLGDGRLLLGKERAKFGLLVIDAFSSDAIPMHLLTREAFTLYRSRLSANGVLALHVSNNYLNLEPVLARLAQDAGGDWTCLIQHDIAIEDHEKAQGRAASEWVVMTRDQELVRQLQPRWQPAAIDPAVHVWTDDFANLFQVFRWR